MTKYTKRQYLADIAANEAAIEAVQAELASYNDRVEAGELITEELSIAWNAAHDKEWDHEQERAAIERKWITRNWTGADYASYELVAANID
jgi:chromosome segregation ATPase